MRPQLFDADMIVSSNKWRRHSYSW